MPGVVERSHRFAQPGCWTQFQNQLWLCVYKAKYAKLIKLVDNTSLSFLQLANPSNSLIIEMSLRNCLQTLLYTSWLEKTNQHKVIIAGDIKIDIRESSHVIYWAVLNKSAEFQPGFLMTELIIEPSHTIIVKYILDKLIQRPMCEPLLNDGVSLLHLAIIVGHMYEKLDESVDLITNYAINNPENVNFICPWTGKSSLDLTLERELGFRSRQLYAMGCRAEKMIDEEKGLAVKVLKVRMPSEESGDAVEGMVKYNKVLENWKNNEEEFIQNMKMNIVGNDNGDDELESSIIKIVYEWIEEKLHELQDKMPCKTKLDISGSVSEETKIRPLDEIDFVIKCRLDIDLQVSDENSTSDWMCNNTLEASPAQKELAKIDSKQPFQHLANVILKDDHPELGDKGDVLTPERFSIFMDDIIWQALNEFELPAILKVPEGKNFLEQTKSGFFMNLEYVLNGGKQELTLDLVTVLILSRENYQKVLKVMPKFDKNKLKFLQNNSLLSCSDGIIVKNDKWRMSFSNGEKKVINLNRDLYRTMKYLNKCSEHHIDIPTYYLKEIFCSFIVHQGINSLPLVRPTLALSMAELVTYCDTELITSPFYCTKQGSKLEKNCSALFRRFREEFAQEFEFLSYLSLPLTPQCGAGLACLAFPDVKWPSKSSL
eukprot:GFUD01040211.1.p1 GENE.GFUD01040211.1~~GFUD01040211.1.p1  ORF type:complete len:677 (+),score=156.40 GFUD01040211.1:62-2032(+)